MQRSTYPRLVTSLAAVCALAPLTAIAESPNRKIAVIDVGHVFKQSSSFNSELTELGRLTKEAAAYRKQQQQIILQLAEKLKAFKPDSQEYADIEEQLATTESTSKLEWIRRRKQLADTEAEMYYRNYIKLRQIVRQIAEYNQIDIVLRYDSTPMQTDNPDSVMRGVMNTVVFHAPSLNLTPMVLQAMDKHQVASNKSTTVK